MLHPHPVVSSLRNCPMFMTMGAGRQMGDVEAHLHAAISCWARASMAASPLSVKGQMRGHHIGSSSSHCSLKLLNHLVVYHKGSIVEGELHTSRCWDASLSFLGLPVALGRHGTNGRTHPPHPHLSSLRKQPWPS